MGGQQGAASVGCNVGGVRQGGSSRPAAVLECDQDHSWSGGPQSSGPVHSCRPACCHLQCCSFSANPQRHGWANRSLLLGLCDMAGRRQSRVHSKISNRTLEHPIPPLLSYYSPVHCAHRPTPDSPAYLVRLCIELPKTLPIFSWGRDHERYSLRQDLQAMCTQVA